MRRMALASVASLLSVLCSSADLDAGLLAKLNNYTCPTVNDNDYVGKLVPLHQFYDRSRNDHIHTASLEYIAEAVKEGYVFKKTIGCVSLGGAFAKCARLMRLHEIYHPRWQTHGLVPVEAVAMWESKYPYMHFPEHSFYCVRVPQDKRGHWKKGEPTGDCGAKKPLMQAFQKDNEFAADQFYSTNKADIDHMARYHYKYIGAIRCWIW